ncbi:MAG TPA: hypothetical protein ENJ50_01240 [Planctomycetaceae bacterium]|nr:hypothetical protein [Planctomycetaceae bacterium]
MSTERYDDVLKQALGLSADEQEQLIRQLARLAAERKQGNGKTLGECMEARGLRGIARGPADLSTNPKYLKGFWVNGN